MSEASRAADSLREKFELYFLALTFTLLGLAIQTFKPSGLLSGDGVEICGWFCLLVSGLLGMTKLEWLPDVLRIKEATRGVIHVGSGLDIRHFKPPLLHCAERYAAAFRCAPGRA